MHRPAPGDVDQHFASAAAEKPELAGPLDRLRRGLLEDDLDPARSALDELRQRQDGLELSPLAARGYEKGLVELGDALGPDAYWRAATWKRIAAIGAGPGANIVLALVLLTILFLTGGGKATTTVDAVATGTPAAAAGLQAGDRIVADRRRAGRGRPDLRADHASKRRADPAGGRPRRPPRDRSARCRRSSRRGATGSASRSPGRASASARRRGSPSASRASSRRRSAHRSAGSSPAKGGRRSRARSGSRARAPRRVRQGTDNYIGVLALISLSLALLNMLPLLPLDGGHVVFALIEGARGGRAVRREVYERVSAVGIVFVVLLFVIGLSNDIGRL